MAIFKYAETCVFVGIDRGFKEPYRLLWHVRQCLPNYTEQHPRGQSRHTRHFENLILHEMIERYFAVRQTLICKNSLPKLCSVIHQICVLKS
jgi:hypothetical protein